MKGKEDLREIAVAIFQAGIAAVDPSAALKKYLCRRGDLLIVGSNRYDLRDYKRVLVVGAGKAAAPMAAGLEEVLADKLTTGLIVVKYGHGLPLKLIKVVEAGHPLPDEAGEKGAEEVINLLKDCTDTDLVFCLLSGGASALLPAPARGISLKDKQEVTNLLLKSGAHISEVNAVRKHLSRLKGGGLAAITYPATLVALILSDCVGDPLEVIASGPTAPDLTSFKDCLEILRRYNIADKVPAEVVERFIAGAEGKVPETPKEGNQGLEKTQNLIVGNNLLATRAARDKAEEMGFNSVILSTFIQGESREVARVLAAIIKEIRVTGQPVAPPACLIAGGETTVSVKGDGMGGRNQELALAAALEIKGLKDVLLLSAGTDGTDGPTDAAGAFADGSTVERGLKRKLAPHEFLERNDAYNYFYGLGDLLVTGPTRTNVMDLIVILVA